MVRVLMMLLLIMGIAGIYQGNQAVTTTYNPQVLGTSDTRYLADELLQSLKDRGIVSTSEKISETTGDGGNLVYDVEGKGEVLVFGLPVSYQVKTRVDVKSGNPLAITVPAWVTWLK